MSALNFVQRPAVLFDVNNADHRRWLGEFTKTLSWGDCPVRLYLDSYGNTVAQMQRMLIEYYTNQEFCTVA